MKTTVSTTVLLTSLALVPPFAVGSLSAGIPRHAVAAPLAAPVDDSASERVIRPKDELAVSVDGLNAPNKVSTVKLVVDEKGRIKLPQVKEPLRAEGLTCGKLAEAVDKAYRDAKLIERAGAQVVFTRAPGP
jgi:protein involved in polysaccharide export with SLBB domain